MNRSINKATGAYTLLSTGWRILVALQGAELGVGDISRKSGVARQGVLRETMRLEAAGYLSQRPKVALFKLTAKGEAAAALPCPEAQAPGAKSTSAAPPPASPPPGMPVGALLPGERRALELVAAHAGKSISGIATAAGRDADALALQIRALGVRGLLEVPRGVLRSVPKITEDGRARLAVAEPPRVAFKPRPLPAPSETRMPTAPAAPRPSLAAAFVGDGRAPGYRGIRHPSLASFGYQATTEGT